MLLHANATVEYKPGRVVSKNHKSLRLAMSQHPIWLEVSHAGR